MNDTITNLDDLCKYFNIRNPDFIAPEILEPRMARRLYDRDNGHLRMRLLRKDDQDQWGMAGIAIGDPEHSPAPSTELRYPFASSTLDTLIETLIAQGKESGPYVPPPITSVDSLVKYLGITDASAEGVEQELNKRGFNRVLFRWSWDDTIPADVTGVRIGSKHTTKMDASLDFPFEVAEMDEALMNAQNEYQ